MSSRKHAQPALPPPEFDPARDLDTLRAMGLEVMSYQNRCTPQGEDGRSYWIPRDLAGVDLALILWRTAGAEGHNYAIDGWAPQLGPHRHGGTRNTLASALAWIQRARDVRDGKAEDFRGV